MKEQAKAQENSIELLLKELEDIDKQIYNIVSSIMQGFAHEEFKLKMDDLKERKGKLSQSPKITECKKFIRNYVDMVVLYKDHVEVIFNVFFNFCSNLRLIR